MNQSTQNSLLPPHKHIAYIQAGCHRDIVEQSLNSFRDTISDAGINPNQVEVFDVPGSLEIPLQSKLLAQSGNYALIVAAGLIVDGGIYRHDFVASTVLDAMMQVQLAAEVPILSVVLTPHHFSGEQVHHDFFYEHFQLKGEEAGRACIQTLRNIAGIRQAA
ncbi:MAG: 6,7-dimethyl-8-ribityllumazine synthase [Pseudomonadota bacterium]